MLQYLDRSNKLKWHWSGAYFVSSMYNGAHSGTQLYIFWLFTDDRFCGLAYQLTAVLSGSNGTHSRTFFPSKHWSRKIMKVWWKITFPHQTCCCRIFLFAVLFRGNINTLCSCLAVHFYQWLTSSVECQAPTWQEKPLYFWLLVQNQIPFPPLSSGSFQALGRKK